MNIEATKVRLTQHLLAITDEKVLERVVMFFKKEVVIEEDEGHISDEEYAQFQEELAKRDRGEIKFHTREESMAEVRRLIDAVGK
jgi:hypothetical protein